VGLCRDRVGERDAAIEAWRETARRFPETTWAGHARERLKERGIEVG
jgi:TolA-binding protein